MDYKVKEKDWKLFKEKLVIWQERHMDNLLNKYEELIKEEKDASERFNELLRLINEDNKSYGVRVSIRRSQMVDVIVSLLQQGIIEASDLDGFSNELIDTIGKTPMML